MKKISYIIFDLLTIAFLIGAYAIQYFTKKKLGMLRWVNYHNMQFQKNAVYGIVKYITVVVIMVLIVLIIAGYKKKKEMLGKINLVMIVVMSVLDNSIQVHRNTSGILLFNAAFGGSYIDADCEKWYCSGDNEE